MIYTVTFNPSLDYIVAVEDFTSGTINRTVDEKIFPGGKGINVSMVLKNLGVESVVLGFLAGFTGDSIRQMLEEKGVAADFIPVDGMSRINVKLRSVRQDADSTDQYERMTVKEETEINGRGPVITASAIETLYEKLDRLKADDILILAGSIPGTMPATIYMDIMQRLQGKGARVVVDATKELLKNVLPYQPFLIKPNHHELGELFGVELADKAEVICYAGKLQEQGARNVLVSMAGDGAVLIAEDGSVHQSKAPEGVVKNSVGAGDSMVAGFLAGYLEQGNYEAAFKLGVCAGSASAFSEELATRDEVLALYDRL